MPILVAMETGPDTPIKKRGQRSWTDAHRAAQARIIRTHKIWNKATGPKTELGKRIASRNSYKHGRFTHDMKVLRWYIRLSSMRIKQVRTHIAHEQQKRENELLNKYGRQKAPRPNTMAFYPYFKVHPLNSPKKVRPKRAKKRSETQKIFDYLSSLSGE